MEITKEDLLEERLAEAEKELHATRNTLNDLIEYLRRTDDNFKVDLAGFSDWRQRLEDLRREEQIQKQISDAKRMLKTHGYLVVENESELDAARVRQWVESKTPDDDIPF